MEITRKVFRFDVLNLNERIYRKEMMIPIIEKFNERAKDIPVYGQIGYSSTLETDVRMVSHIIKKIYIEGDYLMAYIKILNFNEGIVLKEIIDSIVFRPRSVGITLENNEVKLKKIFTFDAIRENIDSFKNLM